MRTVALALASLALLTACGSSPPATPTARSIAARMHCKVLDHGEGFDGADTTQNLSLTGKAPGCLGGEVWTFPDQASQRRWLAQIQNASTQQYGDYNWLVVGRLWAVYPGALDAVGKVISEIGGRESTYL